MTKEECAIVTIYTGVAMLEGDDLEYLYRYAEKLMERPVYTHELAALADELKERAKPDFIHLCRLASAQPKPDINTMPEQPKMDRLGVKTGETCTDTISRQAAIRIASGYCHPTNIAKELAKLPSAQPEQDMVDDLISFIEREKGKENRTLADWTVQWILESIIDGECKITGSATDHEEKKMYVEFSFYQEEHDG